MGLYLSVRRGTCENPMGKRLVTNTWSILRAVWHGLKVVDVCAGVVILGVIIFGKITFGGEYTRGAYLRGDYIYIFRPATHWSYVLS